MRPPATVRTIGEAVKFHRDALAPVPPYPPSGAAGDPTIFANAFLRMSHEYGLANALWESETVEACAEAAELAWGLCRRDPVCDPTQLGASIFLLDVLSEMGDYSGVAEVLNFFPNVWKGTSNPLFQKLTMRTEITPKSHLNST